MHQKQDFTLKEDWSQKCRRQFEDFSKSCSYTKNKEVWPWFGNIWIPPKLFISQRGIFFGISNGCARWKVKLNKGCVTLWPCHLH
jgi:hypothetical protein